MMYAVLNPELEQAIADSWLFFVDIKILVIGIIAFNIAMFYLYKLSGRGLE